MSTLPYPSLRIKDDRESSPVRYYPIPRHIVIFFKYSSNGTTIPLVSLKVLLSVSKTVNPTLFLN